MRLIDADELEELFREVIGGISKKPEMNGSLEHMVRASAMVIEMIKDAPTIEPERKTGRWERKIDGVYCSACYLGWDFITGVPADVETKYRYCPNCGADMRGEQDGKA